MKAPLRESTPAPGSPGHSALYEFCGGLREACWLAAVVIIPLLFSPQALSGYEPIRIAWLQLLALVMLAASLVRSCESRSDLHGLARLGETVAAKIAAGALLLFAGGQVVSSVFSVHPGQSFWGSYEFRQGAFTNLCYLIIFLSVAAGVRRRAQVDRLISAIILPALPLALYALMQWAGFDPLFGVVESGRRVTSLAGNPLYLGGHLGMTLLFTVGRIHALIGGKGNDWTARLPGLGFYGLTAGLQFLALILSQSRAALIALVAALLLSTLAHAAHSSRRRLKVILACIVAGVSLVAAGVFFARGSPGVLTRIPLATRLVSGVTGDDSLKTRLDLWGTAANIATSGVPLRLASGAADRWTVLRPWLGFGPETVVDIFLHYWPFTTINPTAWSHFHSYFWDQWITWGAVGTLAYIGLAELGFYMALRRWGLIANRRNAGVYWLVTLFGTAALSSFLVYSFGLRVVGIGLVAGLAATKPVYIVIKGWWLDADGARGASPVCDWNLWPSVLAVLFFHVLETSVLFPVPATALLFWVSLGLVFGVRWEPPQTAIPVASANRGRHRMPAPSVERGVFIGPVLVGLMLIILGFAIIHLHTTNTATGWGVLTEALLGLKSGESNHLLPLLFVTAWLGGAVGFALDGKFGENGARRGLAFCGGLVLTALSAVIYAWLKAGQIAELQAILSRLAREETALPGGMGYDAITLLFFGVGGMSVVILSWCCVAPTATARRLLSPPAALGALVCFGLGGAFAWQGCIIPQLADARAGWAKDLVARGQSRGAIAAYQDAIQLDARPVNYRANLAALLVGAAESESARTEYETGMRTAEAVLVAGRDLSRFDKGTFMLGEIYLRWAAAEPVPSRRQELAQRARTMLDEVIACRPTLEPALLDSALLDAVFLDDHANAESKQRRADDLTKTLYSGSDSESARAFLTYYSSQSAEARHPELKLRYAQRALRYYELAVAEATRGHQPQFALNFSKGLLHLRLGEPALAVPAFQRAAAEGDPVNGWTAESLLAQTYAALGNKAAASAHLNAACGLAPARIQPLLKQLRMQIEALR
jgi:tetratricopeptide (TPR) repeat protein